MFTVDDFMRVEDVVKGERDWQSVRPCVRRAFEGMAYVLRRHERGAEATRAELEDAHADAFLALRDAHAREVLG